MAELLDAADRESLAPQHAMEPAKHVAPVERTAEFRREEKVECIRPTNPGLQPVLHLLHTGPAQGGGRELGHGNRSSAGPALRLRQFEGSDDSFGRTVPRPRCGEV